MTSIVKWLFHQYELIAQDNIYDREVESWFLVSNPRIVMCCISFYLLIVLRIGPQYMEDRKPLRLKYTLLVYNFALAIFNVYIFKMFLDGFTYSQKYFCTSVPNNLVFPVFQTMCKASWYYFISKIIELLDTVFFVLRKKQSQISFLHVYHHASMVFYAWLFLKYFKTEGGFLIGLLNSFIHIIMYTYYFLAALGPKIQKYLWWKRYLTMLQLVQFATLLIYICVVMSMGCKIHRAFSILMISNTTLIMGMFLNFYKKTYAKRKSMVNMHCSPEKCN